MSLPENFDIQAELESVEPDEASGYYVRQAGQFQVRAGA